MAPNKSDDDGARWAVGISVPEQHRYQEILEEVKVELIVTVM